VKAPPPRFAGRVVRASLRRTARRQRP